MKKLLAICSIFFTVCATFTACGSDDTTYDSNNDSAVVSEDRDDHKIKDHAKDAVDGAGDAGKDIIEGVTDAAGDIIDGLDGKKESRSR
ncbi:MAG TPA: hypothetical protein P5191_09415 [Ruminococcus sp.]|nr:hypothetical protein [Ruminococcus sp.]